MLRSLKHSALVFYGLKGYTPRGNTWSISGARAVWSHGVPKDHLVLLLLLTSLLLLFEHVLLFAPAVGLEYIILGHPKPKKMLIFRFVGIFEYIILLMLILFLDMCQNS